MLAEHPRAYTVEAIAERIAGTYRAKLKALRQEKADRKSVV